VVELVERILLTGIGGRVAVAVVGKAVAEVELVVQVERQALVAERERVASVVDPTPARPASGEGDWVSDCSIQLSRFI
jgi:hypothetical protein